MHPSSGPLLLRLALGAMYVAHALLKLTVFILPGTAAFFETQGLPGALAYPVFAAELIGGFALLLGVHARHVALALVPILIGALCVHAPNGWVFTATGGGYEYPLFLIVVSIAYWFSGDDAFALRRGARA